MLFATSLLKDLFVDANDEISYSVFSTWYKNESHMSDSSTDVPSEKTFWILMNEFMDCHIAFASNDDFKRHFALKLYNNYKEFEATTNAIDALMSLTDSDIEIGNRQILNIADIPETGIDTDGKVDNEIVTVDYVSQQQKNLSQRGKLETKMALLGSKRAYTVERFLAKFKPLFIKILSSKYTYVIAEED